VRYIDTSVLVPYYSAVGAEDKAAERKKRKP